MTVQAGGAAAGGGASNGGTTGTSSSSSGAASGSAAAGAGSAAAGSGSTGSGSAAGSGGSSGAAAAAGASGSGQAANSGASGGEGVAAGAGAGAAAGAAGAAGAAATTAGENWGANWRESYAGVDEKKLKALGRYDSPRAALDALFNAQQKISSGELKAPLAKDATPEQIATYRKDNGIPEKAEGYFEKLPDGVKLDDNDKAMLAPYAQLMHELNLSPDAASKFLQVRAQALDDLVGKQLENDNKLRSTTEDFLRKEWGAEYRANVNNIQGMFQGAPEEVRDAIMSARAPDGRAIFNDPATMQYFAQLARQLSPFHTIVGGDGGALDQKGVEGRIGEIEKLMGKSGSEYWKGPTAEKIQKEYRDLIDGRERLRKRVA